MKNKDDNAPHNWNDLDIPESEYIIVGGDFVDKKTFDAFDEAKKVVERSIGM